MSKKPKTVELLCDGCGKTFERSTKIYNRALRRGHTKFHCSPTCYRKKEPISCFHCGVPTTNPKFCSRSCAASVNSSLFPKRLNYRTPCVCRMCEETYFRSKTHSAPKLCQSCYVLWKNGTAQKETKLGALTSAKSVKGKHPSWKAANVRMLNRQWNKSLLDKPCAKCGYDLHVELAHIRAISSFPKSATLGEVNHPDNVVQLCRNCHWEFDHSFFKLEDLPRLELGTSV